MAQTDPTKFQLLVKHNELTQQVATQLYDVLSTCEVVLLCDDSDSMNKSITEEGTDPFAVKRSTRWLELKKLASVIIDFVTAINPNGLDIYFLNRPTLSNVINMDDLQGTFNVLPNGGTPLSEKINQIYYDKRHVHQNLLIVVVTDGEPTGGKDPRGELYNTLNNKRYNVHISVAECTDNAEDMAYLDDWDGIIKNFDNTDDYREELQRVKSAQGPQFKFDYTDYVIKILLATFVKWYFNLDQTKVSRNPSGIVYNKRIQTAPIMQSTQIIQSIPMAQPQPQSIPVQSIPVQSIPMGPPLSNPSQQPVIIRQTNANLPNQKNKCCSIL